MAFDTSRLAKMAGPSHFGTSWYEYITDGTDTVGSCEESGYFNNTDDFVNFVVGDRIKIIVPGTQTDVPPLKQIVDVGEVMVMSVNSSTGAVDCSADYEATTLTYT